MNEFPIRFKVEKQHTAALKRLARREAATLEEILITIYMIYRWKTGARDMQTSPTAQLRFNQYLRQVIKSGRKKASGKIGIEIGIGMGAGKNDGDAVAQEHRGMRRVLAQVVREPALEISRIEIITEEEKRQILYEFNDTTVIYPWNKTVATEFEEQVDRRPTVTAVIKVQCHVPFEQETLTYGELNKSANRMARRLRQEGVQRGDVVVIMLERTLEMAVAQWAVLKAGATYMPIDPEYPEENFETILEQTGARYAITGSVPKGDRKRDVISSRREILQLSHQRLMEQAAGQVADNLEQMSEPGDLMYIAVTEGPKGEPKGAGVFHRGIMNLIHWFIKEFRLRAVDRNLLMTSPGVEITQKNFYVSLVSGGTLCMPAFQYFEPAALLGEIRDNGVTWINCTPGMFYQLVAYEALVKRKKLASLRYVFLGGESIDMTKLMDWCESDACNAQIVNTYSLGECSDVCAANRIVEPRRYLTGAVPVGKPVYNVQMYVMDESMNQQPVGVPGELYMAGESLGGGYVGDKTLTAEKFIKRVLEKDKSEEELFRTGDKAKRLPDGTIELIGRINAE